MGFAGPTATKTAGSQPFDGASGSRGQSITIPAPSDRRSGCIEKSLATIVVIDDSPTALGVVSRWLEDDGYRVVPLTRSLGATTILTRIRPDILLLDIQLPGLSGDRFAHILSQNPATASIPIIFHSQIDPVELRRLAHECAVVGAIAKTSSHSVFSREFEKLATPFLHHAVPQAGAAAPKCCTSLVTTGIAEIDTQHRRIRELTTRMAEFLRDVKESDERFATRHNLRASILELLVFMRFHFATEDRYLREAGHPFMNEHRARHDAYLEDAAVIERKVDVELSTAEMLECTRQIRLLALEHLWSTNADDFVIHGKVPH